MSDDAVIVWPELKLPHGLQQDARIAPHVLVRSAVFSTLEYAGAVPRPIVVKTAPLRLDAMSHYRVHQLEGPRLSQSDADLMFWLLSRAYRSGAPKDRAMVFFKRSEALAALGRSRGGKTDALLDDSLQRLCAAEFHFEERDETTDEMKPLIQTRLLSRAERIHDEAKPYDYRVTIADGVAPMLDGGSWLILLGKVRRELASDPLAQGLHAQFASNARVHATKSETLKGQMGRAGEMGREPMQDSKWRSVLTKALTKVQAVTRWPQCELVADGNFAGKVLVRKGNVRRRPELQSP